MTRLKRSRPSPALVVGVLALVAALAGTAVAADPVATTSVSKKKTKKIARNQAIKQIDLAFDEAFPVGGDELGAIDEHLQTVQIASGTAGEATVTCDDPGERVITGGWKWDNFPGAPVPGITEIDKREGEGWRAGGFNITGATQPFTVYAYCIEP
ncbi:MAG TPA: hypothetical protein VE401_00110 [Solirubrobacterales bacterium]|jgi:hypothetical protein|nr:hypothetical protein [Solirubrobacterales bacterium]